MFREFFAKKSENALRKMPQRYAAQLEQDSCKRAVGMFPDFCNRCQDLKDTVSLRFHHLLISLEGAERTGCLKLSSRHSRSRAAMLLFRGRVVGCVYGRKGMRGQYLHEDAHKCTLSELATPGNTLDAYELPEEMVLAAASLFYGETLDLNCGQSLEATFDYALSSLMRSGQPGALVVNTAEEQTLSIVYVASGKIVGVYSAYEGWTHGSSESVKRFLRDNQCKVHASILTVTDARHLGFSLTGLGGTDERYSQRLTACEDFSPANSAQAGNSSREAVSQALKQHRSTVEMHRAARSSTYAQV